MPKPEKRKLTDPIRARIRYSFIERKKLRALQCDIDNLSNSILSTLRTPGHSPFDTKMPAESTSAFISERQAYNLFPEIDPQSDLYLGPSNSHVPAANLGANHYFERTQPALVQERGFPFLSVLEESRDVNSDRPYHEYVVSINFIFFAAFLGGDRRFNHDVVYYSPENRFYFYDPFVGCYFPTTRKKLLLGLTQIIQRLIWGLELREVTTILSYFRMEKTLQMILNQAEVILSVGYGFFEGANAKLRSVPENSAAKSFVSTLSLFVSQEIAEEDGAILTISDCLAAFEAFATDDGDQLLSNKQWKGELFAKIKTICGKGLRNDLILPDGRNAKGWKGLKLRDQLQNYSDSAPLTLKSVGPDSSEQSELALAPALN
jgi:hypothetical protein